MQDIKKYRNLVDIIIQNKITDPDKNTFYYKSNDEYCPISNQEFMDMVLALVYSFRKLGIEPGDKVAILSNNRYEWAVADFAALLARAVVVPIYSNASIADIQHILVHSQTKICLVETLENLKIVCDIRNETGTFFRIVLFEGSVESKISEVCSNTYSLGQLMDWGVNQDMSHILDQAEFIEEDDLATIVYTSGTTGVPKGVALSHKNILSNITGIIRRYPVDKHDVVLSFLPLSHIFERTVGYYTPLAINATIYYAGSNDTLMEDILAAKPTVLISVPRLYEKIRLGIYEKMTGFRKIILNLALSVEKNSIYYKKNKKSMLNCFFEKVLDLLFFKKLQMKFGGRIKFFISGGAPLSIDVGRFFQKIGFTIVEGYGLTETSPIVTTNPLDKIRFGTVGIPLDGVQVKCCSDGEILVKGPGVMKGYYKMDEENSRLFSDDGWFSTGDIGSIDEDGYLKIIDRKKEIIVLSNGKNLAPLPIEEKIKMSRYIEQIILIGEKRNYLTALIVPNIRKVREFADKIHKFDSETDLLENQTILLLIESVIKEKQKGMANFEKIKKFSLLSREFSLKEGELTPTLKFRRKIIHEKYKHIIDKMYA